jgi:hypothetical protein
VPGANVSHGQPEAQITKRIDITQDPTGFAAIPGQPSATIRFEAGWTHLCEGELHAGGALTIEYDPVRLPDCRGYRGGMPSWDTDAYVRFQPGGQIYSHSVVRHVTPDGKAMLIPPVPAPFQLTIPRDATEMEIWFQNFDSGGCSQWDSADGKNYRFQIVPHPVPVPEPPVALRWGAVVNREMVNVLAEAATKQNVSDHPYGGATNLRTRLVLVAWARNSSFEKHVWVDLHIFDAAGTLIESATVPLDYAGPGGAGGDLFQLDRSVYQGSVAGPGSISLRPQALFVQYRLYGEIAGETFTDGILHQHELSDDVTL